MMTELRLDVFGGLRTRPRVLLEITKTSRFFIFLNVADSDTLSINSIIFNCKAWENKPPQQVSNQRDECYYIIPYNCLIIVWILSRFHLSEFMSELSKRCSSDQISVNFLKISGRWASADHSLMWNNYKNNRQISLTWNRCLKISLFSSNENIHYMQCWKSYRPMACSPGSWKPVAQQWHSNI